MNDKNRFLKVDLLRALAVFIMIFIHASSLYRRYPTINTLWDITHFVVPIFVFCSAYIFFSQYLTRTNFNFVTFLKKRLTRLLLPYYLFAFVLFLAIFITRPQELSVKYILNSLALTGGININWLALLFIYLVFLLPLMRLFIRERNILFIIFSLLSLTSSFYLLFTHTLFDYRLIMWLPWSLIIVGSYLIYFGERKIKYIYFINIVFGVFIFFISRQILLINSLSLVLFDNKYPPNLYYLSYGWIMINIIYGYFPSYLLNNNLIKKAVLFFSQNSYPLFFVHWLVLYFMNVYSLQNKVSFMVFYIILLAISMALQYFLNRTGELFKTQRTQNI